MTSDPITILLLAQADPDRAVAGVLATLAPIIEYIRPDAIDAPLAGMYDVVLWVPIDPIVSFDADLVSVRSWCPDLPLIALVSPDSEAVVSVGLAHGLTDYVLLTPSQLQRLPGLLRRAAEQRRLMQSTLIASYELRLTRRAMSAVSDGLVIADARHPELPLIYANAAFVLLTGYPLEETLGRNCRFLQGPDTDPAMVAALRTAIQQAQPCHAELLNYRADGSFFWNQLSLAPVFDIDGQLIYYVGTQRDVTARRQNEEDLRRQNLRLHITKQLGQALATIHTDATSALELVAQHITALIGEACAILLLSDDGALLELAALVHPNLQIAALARTLFASQPIAFDTAEAEHVLIQGQPLLLQAAELPRLPAFLQLGLQAYIEHAGLSELLIISLRSHDVLVGMVAVSHSWQSRYYSVDDQALLAELAGQVALAVANERLYRLAQRELQARRSAEASLRESNETLEERIVERTARLDRALLDLQASEARLRTVVSNAPIVLFSIDRMGVFTLSEGRGLAQLGFAPGDIVGRSLFEMYADQVEPLADARRVLVGESFDTIYEIGGSVFEVRYIPIFAEDGSVSGAIGVSVDVTARQRAEDELREQSAAIAQANTELARAARLKDEFLSNMSHELRTPLTSILGRSEMLSDQVLGPLNERQLQSVRHIEESGYHLLALINDILDLSKIEAGKLDLELDWVVAVDLFQTCMQMVTATAIDKHLTLHLLLDPFVTHIYGDGRRLKQILVNLLGNAVKFTPKGGEVGLEVHGDASTSELHLTVWDTGIGIAAEHQSRLFQPFTQIDSSLSRQYDGTGLGLALVARLTNMHGGRVELESALGRGSRFTVILPWQQVSDQQRNPSIL